MVKIFQFSISTRITNKHQAHDHINEFIGLQKACLTRDILDNIKTWRGSMLRSSVSIRFLLEILHRIYIILTIFYQCSFSRKSNLCCRSFLQAPFFKRLPQKHHPLCYVYTSDGKYIRLDLISQ